MSARGPIDIPWLGLGAVGIAALGLWVANSRLETSRPVERDPSQISVHGNQDVDARLWQDPLQTSVVHQRQAEQLAAPGKEEERARHLGSAFCSSLHATSGLSSVLLVMIPGGSYVEYRETRLRMRRAVAAAAIHSHWLPVDTEHVGYAVFDWPEKLGADGPKTGLLAPFEWFVKEGDPAARMIIFWLRQEEFADQPVARLEYFLTNSLGGIPNDAKLAIIGPRSSEDLHRLLIEVSAPGFHAKLPQNTRMLAAMPTASESTLLEGIPLAPGQDTVKAVLETRLPGLTFSRTIAQDDKILAALLDELKLRAVDLKSTASKDAVVLISESDTYYGRSLPATFARLLPGNLAKNNLIRYRYFRGIDGMTPGMDANGFALRKEGSTSEPWTPPADATEGVNQADYLRRLAQQLHDRNKALLAASSGGIRAVGVLGSDVYDKLLVLRALRPTLPGAVFFTNNLDARLASIDEWPATHNLVVAAPYGPLLPERFGPLQGFRDSYQTSVYVATRAALDSDQNRFGVLPPPPPIMYEVGRRGFYEVGPPKEEQEDSLVRRNTAVVQWWNVSRELRAAGIATSAIVALFWYLALIWGRPQRFTERRSHLRRIGLSAPAGAITVILAAYFLTSAMIAYDGRIEPVAWFQGVSIWPTEFLRLVALGLAALFVVRSHIKLAASEQEIGENFALNFPHPPPEKLRKAQARLPRLLRRARLRARGLDFSLHQTFIERWRLFVRRVTLRCWDVEAAGDKQGDTRVDARRLWRCYCKAGRPGARFVRIAPIIASLIFAIQCLLYNLGAPVPPTRGAFAYWADFIITQGAIFAFVAMTCYVVDATVLNRRFIHYLVKGHTVWPAKAVASRRARWSLPPAPGKPPTSGDEQPPERLMVDYLDIEIIAYRTEVVGGLIYYPFIVLSLLIVARFNIFDNWTWPPALVVAIILSVAYATCSALLLRRVAEEARRDALQSLNDQLIAYLVAGDGKGREAETIRETQAIIRAEGRGAFAAISQHPLIGALLLPSGTAALLAASPYLARLFTF